MASDEKKLPAPRGARNTRGDADRTRIELGAAREPLDVLEAWAKWLRAECDAGTVGTAELMRRARVAVAALDNIRADLPDQDKRDAEIRLALIDQAMQAADALTGDDAAAHASECAYAFALEYAVRIAPAVYATQLQRRRADVLATLAAYHRDRNRGAAVVRLQNALGAKPRDAEDEDARKNALKTLREWRKRRRHRAGGL